MDHGRQLGLDLLIAKLEIEKNALHVKCPLSAGIVYTVQSCVYYFDKVVRENHLVTIDFPTLGRGLALS
jgi:hypothetical protein